jgi:hypothetical protein
MACRTCQQIRDVVWRVARFMPTPKDSNLRAWRQLQIQRKQTELQRKRERHLTLEEHYQDCGAAAMTERTAYCDCGNWSGSHCRPAHCGKPMTERMA